MSRDAASGPNGVFDRGLRRNASIVTHGVFPGFFAPLAGNGGAEQNRKGGHAGLLALREQRLGLFEVWGLEALSKLVIDGRKEVGRLLSFVDVY
jgi:hypothetical protein